MEKQMSAPGIHFKGSGWYITDYAKSGGKVPASDGGKADKAERAGTTTETKSESKTETKPETKAATPAPAAPAPAAKPAATKSD